MLHVYVKETDSLHMSIYVHTVICFFFLLLLLEEDGMGEKYTKCFKTISSYLTVLCDISINDEHIRGGLL